jgi:hypothetical protein
MLELVEQELVLLKKELLQLQLLPHKSESV